MLINLKILTIVPHEWFMFFNRKVWRLSNSTKKKLAFCVCFCILIPSCMDQGLLFPLLKRDCTKIFFRMKYIQVSKYQLWSSLTPTATKCCLKKPQGKYGKKIQTRKLWFLATINVFFCRKTLFHTRNPYMLELHKNNYLHF